MDINVSVDGGGDDEGLTDRQQDQPSRLPYSCSHSIRHTTVSLPIDLAWKLEIVSMRIFAMFLDSIFV